MGIKATKDGGGTWLFLAVGAAIGLTFGVLVSLTTDLPLAPEGGLIIGLFVGWLLRSLSRSSP